ncbi:pilus assembly protein FimV [Actimicrobium sp. GrIS 1.19]|uniref:type IV pilus assembly protein FimV n=1 Tax=Actimicrobium sp. GrIS 1.19 TaxID=3071708 RepID=UPI002DFCC1B0|nr:pilus assembly protein FimV [Actimicrobium sp. GrIS 1.19]
MLHQLRTPELTRIAFAVLAAWIGTAQAVGLGSARVQSALGQPLQVVIPLIGTVGPDLTSACIKARLESSDGAFMSSPNVALRRAGAGSVILLSTRATVNEPALTISVDLACGAVVHREFQVLLDPVGNLPTLADAADLPLLDTAPVATSSRTENIPSTVGRARNLNPRARTNSAIAGTANSNAPAKLTPAATLAPIGAPRSVLKLSSDSLSNEDLAALGHLKLSGALVDAVSSSDEVQRQEIRDAQRRFAMILRGEDPQRVAEQARAAEQSRNLQLTQQAATSAKQRDADRVALDDLRQRTLPFGWMVGLAALLLASLGAVGWLSWRLSALRRQAVNEPWDRTAAFTEPEPEFIHDEPEADVFSPNESQGVAGARLFADSAKAPADLGSVPEFLRTSASPAPTTGTMEYTPSPLLLSEMVESSSGAAAAAQVDALQFYPGKVEHLKVEEISDVMQEAEFWMSLNDPQRAIEILEPYGDVERPESPMPWLFLLDLYRSNHEQAKYEALRERAGTVFNARIPPWSDEGSEIVDGRSVEDFPHMIEQICALWETDQIVPYLESLVFDNREGIRTGFDLSVYQDIMMLMAIARGFDRTRRTQPFGDPQLANE